MVVLGVKFWVPVKINGSGIMFLSLFQQEANATFGAVMMGPYCVIIYPFTRMD